MTATNNLERLLEDLGRVEVRQRVEAQRQLVMYGENAVEPLIHLLREGSLRQVAAAINTLAQISNEPMRQFVDDDSRHVQCDAKSALEKLAHNV